MSYRKYPFNPDYVVPPGATISELMYSLGMSRPEMAEQLGISRKQMDALILGDLELSHEIACELAYITKVPVTFWVRCESQYRKGFAAGKARST